MDRTNHCAICHLPGTLGKSVSMGWLMLTLQCILASEPATARTRAEPAAGYTSPAISAQALDNSPVQLGTLSIGPQANADRAIERDLAQLLERANGSPRSNTPQANRRSGSNRIDTSPVASAADAAWLLGLIYAHGAGVAPDVVQAQLWFERAVARGQSLGAVGLAWCAIEGCKQAPNLAQARTRISNMRTQLPARALYLEWWMLSKNAPLASASPKKSNDINQDDDATYRLASRQLLEQAARLGDIHALIELGLEAIALGNKTQARQWFEQAASAGSGAATHNLQLLDLQQANSNSAVNSHVSMDAATLLAMAQRNHRGLGQPANYTEAIRLYRLAESKGSTAARDMLALIFSRPTAAGQLDIAWMQRLAALNISNPSISIGSPMSSQVFQRERSPLFDFLPTLWKSRTRPIG